MKNNANLEHVISKIGDLPAMPEAVGEVLRLTDDPQVGMVRVSEAIQQDPALTAKILKVSNSPYYGMKQYVGTLKLALVILGVREVRNIVLGVSVFDALHNDRTETLLTGQFWTHSFTVAGLAKQLGLRLHLGLQGEDFISGLLHDIGKMVMCRQLGGQYETVFRASGGSSDALCAAERDAFGFNHAEAGAALALYWNLPETLADSLWLHHAQADADLSEARDPKLASLIRVANRAAHDGITTGAEYSCSACGEESAWKFLDPQGTMPGIEQRSEFLSQFGEVFSVSTPMH
ncbi:MAG: HDOD domain-containing protein [Candidatus Hydrogenedentes bacterium]|nr:HDOD domain-containing protein [Candidatus Hydrogenedentota bacterium]